jgi:hypothetical protein
MFGAIVLPNKLFNEIIQPFLLDGSLFAWPTSVFSIIHSLARTMSNSLNISAASHEGKLFIVKQSVEANANAVNTVDEVLVSCNGMALPCFDPNSANALRCIRTNERLCTGQRQAATLISLNT